MFEQKVIALEGGIIKATSPAVLGLERPGALTDSLNFEPGTRGGYRRIDGYQKYDAAAIPGTGPVLGVCVYEDVVLAARENDVYTSGGSGWTKINGLNTRPGAGRYRFEKYNWSTPSVIMVDGINAPAHWNGTAYTEISDLNVAGADFVVSFQNHMFYIKDQKAFFSAPNNELDLDPVNGAGEINIGFVSTGAAIWRDQLYIFGRSQISKITGQNATNFALNPVSANTGCISPDSIQEFGADLVYLSNDGFRTVAGTERLGDIELGIISKAIDCVCINLRDRYTADNILSVVVRGKNQYRAFGYNTFEGVSESAGLLMGMRYNHITKNSDREWFRLQGIQPNCLDSDYINNDELIVFGDRNGFVHRLDSGTTFDGAIIENYFYTSNVSFDNPAYRKTLYKVWIEVELEGSSSIKFLTATDTFFDDIVQPPSRLIDTASGNVSIYDDVTTLYDDDDVYDALPKDTYVIPLVGSGFRHSFGVTQELMGSAFAVKSLIIEYALDGNR